MSCLKHSQKLQKQVYIVKATKKTKKDLDYLGSTTSPKFIEFLHPKPNGHQLTARILQTAREKLVEQQEATKQEELLEEERAKEGWASRDFFFLMFQSCFEMGSL